LLENNGFYVKKKEKKNNWKEKIRLLCYFIVHIIVETTAQIPEVEFRGKYGYLP
jgi:hypothetical protein